MEVETSDENNAGRDSATGFCWLLRYLQLWCLPDSCQQLVRSNTLLWLDFTTELWQITLPTAGFLTSQDSFFPDSKLLVCGPNQSGLSGRDPRCLRPCTCLVFTCGFCDPIPALSVSVFSPDIQMWPHLRLVIGSKIGKCCCSHRGSWLSGRSFSVARTTFTLLKESGDRWLINHPRILFWLDRVAVSECVHTCTPSCQLVIACSTF